MPKRASASGWLALCSLLLCCWYQPAWSNESTCNVPLALKRKIDESYLGYSIVTVGKLRRADRSLFRKDHGRACPGLVKLDFYGSGTPTYGVSLTKRQNRRVLWKIVVATHAQGEEAWALRELDESTSLTAAPVIWREAAGHYVDRTGKKDLYAKFPVLLAAQYHAWAIVFGWQGDEVQKIWVSD